MNLYNGKYKAIDNKMNSQEIIKSYPIRHVINNNILTNNHIIDEVDECVIKKYVELYNITTPLIVEKHYVNLKVNIKYL